MDDLDLENRLVQLIQKYGGAIPTGGNGRDAIVELADDIYEASAADGADAWQDGYTDGQFDAQR